MFVIIDNTGDDTISFVAYLNKKFVQKIFTVNRNQDLLVCLDQWLQSVGQSVKDVAGIGVVVGVGKFTSTRLAVTLANTLAFSLHIPVVTLEKEYDQEKAVHLIQSAQPGIYAMPVYSAAPHLYGQNQ